VTRDASPAVEGLSAARVSQSLRLPVERRLRLGSVRLVRLTKWWCRHLLASIIRAVRTWWRWVVRGAILLLIGIVLAMCDRELLAQWRAQGLSVFRVYLPLGLLVYLLALFDRRSSRLGRVAVGAALVYGVVSRDLIPDHLRAGLIDDIVIIGAASRLFVNRCGQEVFERHAQWAQAWRARAREIRHRRRSASGTESAGLD